jgi:MFS family permease
MPPVDREPPAPAPPDEGPSSVPPVSPAAPGPARSRAAWGWALSAGVIAGVASGLVGEASRKMFPSALSPKIEAFPTPEGQLKVIRDRTVSAAVIFAQQGAILGLALGMAGGLARRSPRAGLAAAALGLVLGAAASGGAALGLVPIYFRNENPEYDPLVLSLLTHAGIWMAAGAAAGLAFGVGLGGRARAARAAMGGLLGAAGGTMLYEMVGALAFPLAKTSQPVSEAVATRLLAHLAVAALVAVGAAMGAGGEGGKPRHTPPPP